MAVRGDVVTRIAFSLWNERIAPVFDVARHILIVEGAEGHTVLQVETRFSNDDPWDRVQHLKTLQVGQLVCGAISRSFYEILTEQGIEVISFIAGSRDVVIKACLAERLFDGRMSMPGCDKDYRRDKHLTLKH